MCDTAKVAEIILPEIKVLDRLLDSFEGKLTASKWARLAKCSQDTACGARVIR